MPKPRPKTKSAPQPKAKPPLKRAAKPKPPPSVHKKPVPKPTPPPVTATVLQGVDGIWAVDVAISHGDLTVVRINGRAVWLGTP